MTKHNRLEQLPFEGYLNFDEFEAWPGEEELNRLQRPLRRGRMAAMRARAKGRRPGPPHRQAAHSAICSCARCRRPIFEPRQFAFPIEILSLDDARQPANGALSPPTRRDPADASGDAADAADVDVAADFADTGQEELLGNLWDTITQGTSAPFASQIRKRSARGARPDQNQTLQRLDLHSPTHTRWLQRALNQALGLRLPLDGAMSPAVRSAMRSLQRQQGMPEDGELSDELEAELVRMGAPAHRHGEDEGEAFIGDLWDSVTGAAGRLASGLGSLSSGGASATLRRHIADIARTEWERWRRGATKEGDPAIRSVLTDYWNTGVGWLPNQSNWWSAVPWSAAFISWVVKQAGAGNSFKYSAGHAVYIAWAKRNKLAGNSNPFKAYRVGEAAPRVGDIVCKDRGSGATYDNIQAGMTTHCDIVVSVQPNSITTIGGNRSDSVGQHMVTTDAQGHINKPGYFAVIRVGD